MARTSTLVFAACLLGAAPALAQVHDGINDSPAQQRVADELRDAGSKCVAPACHGGPDGAYPPPARPGDGAKTPSIPAGQPQPRD